MANTNPDIELVVGVDSGNSYTTMKDGINQVLRDIEGRNPPKIKIQLDDAEINNKLQSLRSQITALSENKISINITGATQGVEKTIKSAISNYEQAYYFVNTALNSPKATEQLERVKHYLEKNTVLATEFYRALAYSYSSDNVNQLISTFRSLCKEESDAATAAQQFRDIIRQQFEVTVPEMEKFNQKGFEALAVLKKFDKAMGGAGEYTGKEFFEWLGNSATKAQKALFGFERGLSTVQSALERLHNGTGTGLFMEYVGLGDGVITLKQDEMKRLSAATKGFKETVDSSNQSLANLKQVLTSVFNISPQNFENSGVTVTLQQLQQIIDQAPYAQELIWRIRQGFTRAYSPPDSQGITEYLNGITTAEQSLQAQTERLSETMNNSITSDAFNSKLGAINDSVSQVSASISTLAKNISSALSKSADNTMLNVNPDALKVVEELLRGIYNIANGIDMSKVINEISKVGDAASGTKAKISAIGESVTKSTINVSKIKEMLSTKDLDASVARVTDRFEKLGNSGATGLGKIKTDIAQINTLLASLKSTQVLSNDNDLLGTYQKLSTLLETVRNKISIIESRTNTAKKINFGIETKKFQADIDAVYQAYNKLNNATDTIRTNLFKLQDEFNTLNSYSASQDQNVAAYEKLKELIPVVTKQISVQAAEEAKAIKIATTNNKINFGIDTAKFKTDMDLIQRDFDKLKGSTSILATNLGELHTAFTVLEGGSSTQEQRVAAYEKLKALIPVVRQQVKVQANEEKAAMQANNKAIREATLESKKQNAIEEKANTQRRIALDLLAKITKAQQEWTKAQNGKTSNEYAQLQNYSNQLTTLLNQLANYSMPKANFTAQVKSINDEFARTSSVIRSAGEDTKSLKDRFGALTGTFSMWFSTTRIIMMVYSNIRKMISASIELDKSMTQLQIVTKENDETMTKFGNTAADTARKIGSSITDFTSSVTTFARLGYSIGESSQLAEFTAMLQNVGDIDVSEAQEAITSIVKAFNIGTDQIESVMDKMVVSGNQFPISVSEIAVGMKNASSALAAAGNSFDQSVALLTAANTTINLCRVA